MTLFNCWAFDCVYNYDSDCICPYGIELDDNAECLYYHDRPEENEDD